MAPALNGFRGDNMVTNIFLSSYYLISCVILTPVSSCSAYLLGPAYEMAQYGHARFVHVA